MAAVTSLAVQAANRRELEQGARNLAGVIRAAGLGSANGLNRVGIAMVNDVKRELSKPGRGRVYVVGKTPTKGDKVAGRKHRTHTASAPGDPPAVDTGRYRASWTYFVQRTLGAPVLFIGTPSVIGGYLEFGTRRMAPRPHLRPVVARFATRIPRIVRDEVAAQQRAAVSGLGRSLRLAFGPF